MLSFFEVLATYLHVNFVVDVVYVGRYDNPSYSFYTTVQFFSYVRWSLSSTSRGRTAQKIATSASSCEINYRRSLRLLAVKARAVMRTTGVTIML